MHLHAKATAGADRSFQTRARRARDGGVHRHVVVLERRKLGPAAPVPDDGHASLARARRAARSAVFGPERNTVLRFADPSGAMLVGYSARRPRAMAARA